MTALRVMLLGLLSGCLFQKDPLIGMWDGRDAVGDSKNSMTVNGDFSGSATIYFYVDATKYFSNFTAPSIAADGDHYVIELDSDESTALDFRMTCDMFGDDRMLSCTGTQPFEMYDFQWVKGGGA